MTRLIRRFLKNDSGATAIEYSLIAALIFLVIVASVGVFASKVTVIFDKIATAISEATG